MAKSTCSIEGCPRPLAARGWCHTHYEYWRRTGTPVYVPRTEQERFWSKVDKTGGCWLWTGPQAGRGFRERKSYGVFSIGERKVYAHRYAYELLVGPIPDDLELDHLCRVKFCVNPAHLEAVTADVNKARALPFRKPRTHCPKGHPYVGDNVTRYGRVGALRCRACTRDYEETRRPRRNAA